MDANPHTEQGPLPHTCPHSHTTLSTALTLNQCPWLSGPDPSSTCIVIKHIGNINVTDMYNIIYPFCIIPLPSFRANKHHQTKLFKWVVRLSHGDQGRYTNSSEYPLKNWGWRPLSRPPLSSLCRTLPFRADAQRGLAYQVAYHAYKRCIWNGCWRIPSPHFTPLAIPLSKCESKRSQIKFPCKHSVKISLAELRML